MNPNDTQLITVSRVEWDQMRQERDDALATLENADSEINFHKAVAAKAQAERDDARASLDRILKVSEDLAQAARKDRDAVVMMLRSSHIQGSSTTVMDDKLVNLVAMASIHLNDSLIAYREIKP